MIKKLITAINTIKKNNNLTALLLISILYLVTDLFYIYSPIFSVVLQTLARKCWTVVNSWSALYAG